MFASSYALGVTSSEPRIRPACRGDLEAIVALYADDTLVFLPEHTSTRPGEGAPYVQAAHLAAFEELEHDPDNTVYVAELEGQVVGTFQLTFIRQLSYTGSLVAQVESVYVSSGARSQGIGRSMLEWAIDAARQRGALRIQLTTNGKRERAHRFYERLGFRATHKGMKLYLT